MKTRLFCVLLAVFAVIRLFAASGKCGDNVNWSLNEQTGVLTISGSGPMWNWKSQGSPWYKNLSIKKVVVNPEVSSIGERAFYCCESLTSITISNSVTNIGKYAFFFCENLTSITIPKSVKSVGEGAFQSCKGLTSVIIPNSVTNIGENAFYYCESLTSITIPKSVKSIGLGAFSFCESLTSIIVEEKNTKYDSRNNCNAIIESATNTLIAGCQNTVIPPNVTSIGERAFRGCENLTSITIPNSVTSVGEGAFQSCKGLTSVIIPNSVTNIGENAFNYCESLTSITIPKSVTTIGNSAFHLCKGLTSVIIPNSVTNIGEYAFCWCNSLTSITIPNSVKSIGLGVFSFCESLTSIIVEEKNTKYDSRNNCNAIIESATNTLIAGCQNTIIPPNVTSIGERAFSGCESLTSITIPNSVTDIGKHAFSWCNSLTSITIPNSVTNIGENAFYYCKSLTSVSIPHSVTNTGEYAFSFCESLTSIIVEEKNTKYDSRNNCNAIIESATNTLIAGCQNTVIPPNVTSIGERAFYGCESLTSITIPNSVTNIGENAFFFCTGLTSVIIPNSVTSIGEYAFSGCKKIEEFYYPQGLDLSKTGIPPTSKLIAYNPANPPTQVAPSSVINESVAQNAPKNTTKTTSETTTMAKTQGTPVTPTSAISQSTPILPQCRINFPATNTTYNSSHIRLCYSIDGEISENYKIEFFVRGKRVDPIHQTQNKGAKSVPCTEVVLPMPEIVREEVSVDIRIVDKNTKRKWIADEITLTYESVIKPTLHIFAVGISEYPVSDLEDLKYGAKDAQDFVNTINSLDLSQYKEVKQTLILNKDATADSVRSQLSKLTTRVCQNDVVMFFFSGHGINNDDDWYFMTYNVSASKYVNALDFSFIKKQMLKMSKDKNCHVLIFMDACHSGGMYGQKGYVKDITLSEAGINGFYSSTASEKSREENGNGLFTRALIDGIKGAADIDNGGSITISELREYIDNTLKEKGQSPVFYNPGGDYVIFYKKK